MSQTLAIMFTITTYGTWLRGDARGWVDKGVVFPPDPVLEQADRARMRFPPYLLPADTWRQAGEWIGTSLAERLGLQVYALTVQPWHVHFVVGAAATPVGARGPLPQGAGGGAEGGDRGAVLPVLRVEPLEHRPDRGDA